MNTKKTDRIDERGHRVEWDGPAGTEPPSFEGSSEFLETPGPVKIPAVDVARLHRAIPPSGFMEAMMRTEQERIEAALRRVIGLPDGDVHPSDVDRAARESGACLARHTGDGRPYVQIRDRDDRVLWDGWWDCVGTAFTWREGWAMGSARPTSCETCSHLTGSGWPEDPHNCGHPGGHGRVLDDVRTVPDNCPLPDPCAST